MPSRNGADVAADLKRTSKDARRTAEDAKSILPGLARLAEEVFQDKAHRLKSQSKDAAAAAKEAAAAAREAAAAANEQLETARTYVVERVQERPFTTTLAVLGAGFLLGLLFAGRRR